MGDARLIVERGRVRLEPPDSEVPLASDGSWRVLAPDPNVVILERGSDGGRGFSTGGDVIVCGNIATAGVADVVSFVYSQAKTGVLTLFSGTTRKTVLFDKGNIRAAASNLPEDRLGEMLYRSGKLSREQLQAVVSQLSAGRKIGRVLVDNGYISANELWQYIRQQVEEIFYSILLIRHGAFLFLSITGRPEDQFPAHITLSTQSLLLDGVRRIDEMAAFREKISSDQTVITRCETIPSTPLEPREQEVLAHLPPPRSIAELSRETRLGEFETTKIAFRLLQTRFVRVVEEHPGARMPADRAAVEYHLVVKAFNLIYQEIHAAMSKFGRARPFRSAIEAFLSASGGSEIFKGVAIEEDGTVDPSHIIANLERLTGESHSDALYMALNELVYFQLFHARDDLPPEEETKLMQKVNEIFRSFPTASSR